MDANVHDALATEMLADDENLSPGEIAAFLDGPLEGDDLRRVERYLADHPDARQEIIAASRIISSAPALKRRSVAPWLYPIVGIAAAAALVFAIQPKEDNAQERLSTERRAPIERVDHLELVSPANGEQIGTHTAPFSWRKYDGASYRFVISDAAGAILFEKATTDTLLTVSPAMLKASSGKLYWSVDALGASGSSLTSSLSEFEFRVR